MKSGLLVSAAAVLVGTTLLCSPASATEPREFLLYFDSGSVRLRPDAVAQLREIVAYSETFRTAHCWPILAIRGYADTEGSRSANLSLSRARAEGVKAALLSRGLASPDVRLSFVGEEQQAVEVGDEIAEQLNRRVSVNFVMGCEPGKDFQEP